MSDADSPEVVPKPAAESEPNPTAGTDDSAWVRLRRMGRPRATRANLLAGLLAVLLGFAMVTQVRQTRTAGLEDLRQSDLVALLASVNNQSTRLERDADALTGTRDRLRADRGGGAAIAAAQERLDTMRILAGTTAATGPGITITISDNNLAVGAPNLLDMVQELRDAGAEAIQIGNVRVVADTWFGTNDANIILIDGHEVRPPYVVRAIGDSHTMSTAMAIPGGVSASMQQLGAEATVVEIDSVVVDALRPLTTARYAQPDQ